MTKKQLATLIVETEFNKKYKTVLDDFDNSDYKKSLQSRFRILKFAKIVFLVIGFYSFFVLVYGFLDLMYSRDSSWTSMFVALIALVFFVLTMLGLYFLPLGVIYIFLDITSSKKPIGKYCFKGFDEYMLNNVNLKRFEKIFMENGIVVKIHRGLIESIRRFYSTKISLGDIIIVLYSIIHIGLLYVLTVIDFEDQRYFTGFFYTYLILFIVTMTIILKFLILMYTVNKKNLNEYIEKCYDYNYFEVVESKPYIREFSKKNSPFLEKVFLMDVILRQEDNHYNFINSDNYADFLGELAESLTYELVAFEDEFRYLLTNEKFIENDYLKMALDICVEGLARLDRAELNALNTTNVKRVLWTKNNRIFADNIKGVCDYFVSDKIGQDSALAVHGKKLTFGTDEYKRNIKTDSRVSGTDFSERSFLSDAFYWLSTIPTYCLPLSYHYLRMGRYPRFFQPYLLTQRGFGFVGIDSSCLQVLFHPAKIYEPHKIHRFLKELDSSNMYKSYQFVLTGENPLKKQDDYFVSEVVLKNQLFYQNMLILSEKVVDLIKDYCIITPIEVRYGNQSETYYICEPKTYEKEVLNEQMSLYFEEFGNRLVKNSFLIEPCIIKDRAEELKVFGVVSKRVEEYQYVSDYQYSYVMFTEEIKNHLDGFDDLAIIRNERGVGSDTREEKHNIVSLKSDDEIVLDIANEDFSMFVNKSKYSYPKKERVMYTLQNLNLILNAVICIAIIIAANHYIRNIPTDLFSNIPESELNSVKIFRLINLIVPPLMFYSLFIYKRFVISPVTVIKQGKLLHRVRSVLGFGKSSVRYHAILDDDLNMAFHKNKIMFELPIENKFKYIDDELYYNGTSYALNGIEVNMEKAVDKGESFVHEVHNVYYQSNQVWKKIRER